MKNLSFLGSEGADLVLQEGIPLSKEELLQELGFKFNPSVDAFRLQSIQLDLCSIPQGERKRVSHII